MKSQTLFVRESFVRVFLVGAERRKVCSREEQRETERIMLRQGLLNSCTHQTPFRESEFFSKHAFEENYIYKSCQKESEYREGE